MAISWVTGDIGSLEIVWTTFTIENVPVDSTKTVTDVDFEIAHDTVGHSVYYDEFSLTSEVTSADDPQVEEEDITYVTIDDHSTVLPSSIQHENILETNKHTPKAHTLGSHSDVVIASPIANHFLGWDTGTSKWINKLASVAGADHSTLNQLDYASAGHTGFAPATAVYSTVVLTADLDPLVVGTRYIMNDAVNICDCVLPATAAVGDMIQIVGMNANGWKVTAAAGDTIVFGNLETIAAGYIASTHDKDCVELICMVADTQWQVINAVGNIDVEIV